MSSEVDAAYRERARLVAVLAAIWPSVITFSDPNEPDWAVVTIDSPKGQLSWHIHRKDLDVVKWVPWVTRDANRAQWDGHTTEQKYDRLSEIVWKLSTKELTLCTADHDTSAEDALHNEMCVNFHCQDKAHHT